MAGRNNINLGGGEYNPHIRGRNIQGRIIRGDYVRGEYVDVQGDYVENTPPPSNGNPQHQQNPEPSMEDLFNMTPQELQDYVNSVKAKYQGGGGSQQQPDRSGWTQYTSEGTNYINTNGGDYCEHIEGDFIQGCVVNGKVYSGDVWSSSSSTPGSNVWDDGSNDAEPTIDVEATEVKGDNDSEFGGWLGGLWK